MPAAVFIRVQSRTYYVPTPPLLLLSCLLVAGGGSRLMFRGGLFVVGPESVGAHPGPVCYKKGGSLAITDANAVLGRIVPDFFPKVGPAASSVYLCTVHCRQSIHAVVCYSSCTCQHRNTHHMHMLSYDLRKFPSSYLVSLLLGWFVMRNLYCVGVHAAECIACNTDGDVARSSIRHKF